MPATYSYSFANVVVTVNGLKVTGFWEGDDAVQVAPSADNATPLVGADGEATVSYSMDDSVRVTMRLKPNSPMNAILEAFYRRARARGIGTSFPVSLLDTSNGEGGSGADGHVIQAPERQFGGNATVREWVLFVNSWQWSPVRYPALVG